MAKSVFNVSPIGHWLGGGFGGSLIFRKAFNSWLSPGLNSDVSAFAMEPVTVLAGRTTGWRGDVDRFRVKLVVDVCPILLELSGREREGTEELSGVTVPLDWLRSAVADAEPVASKSSILLSRVTEAECR